MVVKSFFLIGAIFWYSAGVWQLINDYFHNEFKTKMADDLKRALEIQPPPSMLTPNEKKSSQSNIVNEILKNTVFLRSDTQPSIENEKGNSDIITKNSKPPTNTNENLLTASLNPMYSSDSSSNNNDIKCQNVDGSENICKTVLGVNDFQITKNNFISKNDITSTRTATTTIYRHSIKCSRDDYLADSNSANNKINCNTATNVNFRNKFLKRSKQAVNDISNEDN